MDNTGKGVGSWLSCLVMIIIGGVIMRFFFRFLWVLLPVFIVLNWIRFILWKRRLKKHMQEFDFAETNAMERHNPGKYCEAEFEILDDETEQ